MEENYFSFYESPIGLMRIGGTENYISEISFIDTNDQVNYGLPGVSEIIHQCTEQLIEFFQGTRKKFDLPIHQTGTDFQKRVWNELCRIPTGEVRSYSQQAMAIGSPSAVRAVARANGANQLAIVIPCHRVIGANGELTGYGGGLAIKKWLLEHEGAMAQAS